MQCPGSYLPGHEKALLIYVPLALGLAATNWFWENEYVREVGVTGRWIRPAGYGILFCGVGIWYLGRRAYKVAREMLDAGTRLGKTEKLISFKPVPLLLPLLVHYHNSSVDRLLDGTTVNRSYGYGTDGGWIPFLLGTVLILLFQLVMKLERAKVSDGMPVVRAA